LWGPTTDKNGDCRDKYNFIQIASKIMILAYLLSLVLVSNLN
jgi:hypothetical protein